MKQCCGKCKHWSQSSRRNPEHGRCLTITNLQCGQAAFAVSPGQGSDFFTLPSFGCTLFEARPEILREKYERLLNKFENIETDDEDLEPIASELLSILKGVVEEQGKGTQ